MHCKCKLLSCAVKFIVPLWMDFVGLYPACITAHHYRLRFIYLLNQTADGRRLWNMTFLKIFLHTRTHTHTHTHTHTWLVKHCDSGWVSRWSNYRLPIALETQRRGKEARKTKSKRDKKKKSLVFEQKERFRMSKSRRSGLEAVSLY